MRIRKLTADEVTFEVECLEEHVPYKGNCSAIDNETDKKTEKWIQRQLYHGNQWAWCTVRVVARWNDYEGDDFLGCCSYRSKAAFCLPGGYFDDMKFAALENLNDILANHATNLQELTI